MEFSLKSPIYSSFAQAHAWYLGVDRAEFQAATPSGLSEPQAQALGRAQADYSQFYDDLLADLYQYPEHYGVPNIPYQACLEGQASPAELAWARESILKVRKVIDACVLDFLYKVGHEAELQDGALILDRGRYNQIVTEKSKRSKSLAFLKAYERVGLRIVPEVERVHIANERHPAMPLGLQAFSRQCAPVKEYDFYFFRRCDFQVFAGKRLPAFEDALQWVPPQLLPELLRTNALLNRLQFKREILTSETGSGYRLRYQKRNVVYWCRVHTQFNPDLKHNLRWELASEQTPRLFARLDGSDPALAQRVLAGLHRCEHHFENCKSLARIEIMGEKIETCNENGWAGIGLEQQDFEDVRQVLEALNE